MKNIFGYDPEEITAIPLPELDPPLIMTFTKFEKGDYPDANHNLYIVWRGKQALYIGISQANIWDRWFIRDGCHIASNGAGIWCAAYSSPIGRAIARNRPASIPYPWIRRLTSATCLFVNVLPISFCKSFGIFNIFRSLCAFIALEN